MRWAKAKEIISTWIITIPGAGTVAICTYLILKVVGWRKRFIQASIIPA